MLRKNVGRFQFRIRVTSGEPLVFPLRLEDLGATLDPAQHSRKMARDAPARDLTQ